MGSTAFFFALLLGLMQCGPIDPLQVPSTCQHAPHLSSGATLTGELGTMGLGTPPCTKFADTPLTWLTMYISDCPSDFSLRLCSGQKGFSMAILEDCNSTSCVATIDGDCETLFTVQNPTVEKYHLAIYANPDADPKNFTLTSSCAAPQLLSQKFATQAVTWTIIPSREYHDPVITSGPSYFVATQLPAGRTLVEHCQDRCIASPDCAGFAISLYWAVNQCWLRSSLVSSYTDTGRHFYVLTRPSPSPVPRPSPSPSPVPSCSCAAMNEECKYEALAHTTSGDLFVDVANCVSPDQVAQQLNQYGVTREGSSYDCERSSLPNCNSIACSRFVPSDAFASMETPQCPLEL